MDITSAISAILGYAGGFLKGTMSAAGGISGMMGLGIIGTFIIVVFFLYMLKNNISAWWMLALIAALIVIGAGYA